VSSTPPVRLRHSVPRHGRPFNTSTPLGKAMQRRGLKVGDVAAIAGISERYLSDFLAGRKVPSEEQLLYLARAVDAPVNEIRPES